MVRSIKSLKMLSTSSVKDAARVSRNMITNWLNISQMNHQNDYLISAEIEVTTELTDESEELTDDLSSSHSFSIK